MKRRPRFRPFAWLRRWILRVVALVIVIVVGGVLLFSAVPPPITPLMVIRLAQGEGLQKDWTALEALSPHVPRAVVALEDNLFCEHHGLDWSSMWNAVTAHASGESAGGASTITMQTAKNLFLWPERHLARKVIEIPIAGLIELIWSKRRIMEVYLNIAEWGPGIYGAETAAQTYFGKPARAVSQWEAALLASVLPNPRRWSPAQPTPYLNERAREARLRVRQLGPMLDCLPE